MLHPSTKRLIDKLSDMTRRQRVAWTEGENATVVHDTEGYRVVITPEPHAVLLTDGMGREIESCLPDEFVDELDAQGRPYARFIAELYRDAHRHARGTEKAISTLLAGLEAVEDAAPVWPVPDLGGDAPDSTTDETALIESETAITAAVATLADQINGGAAPPAETPEPEPAPVMAAETSPVEDAVSELAAPPESVASPEPEIVQAVIEPEAPVLVEPEPAPELAPGPEPEPEREPEIAPAAVFAAEEPAASVEVEPLAEEPGSFGTFGAFFPSSGEPSAETATEMQVAEAPAAEPAPEPFAAEVAAEHVETETLEAPPVAPEPVVAPEPQPEIPVQPAAIQESPSEPTLATPTLAQPISLSSIPFGFGLGAAQRSGTPTHPATPPASVPPPPKPATAAPTIIDGTLDLPEQDLMALDEAPVADPFVSQRPGIEFEDLPSEPPSSLIDPGKPRRFNPWN